MSVHRTSNGTWVYCFEYLGKRYKKRFKTQQQALLGEAEKRSELSRGLVIDRRITFREASQLFFEKHAKPNKSSWDDDLSKIKTLNELFGDKRLIDFTPIDIQNLRDYLKRKGRTFATVDRYHALVKTIFNKMIFWRKFSGFNPACGVKLRREPNAHVRWLSKDELQILKPVIPGNIYPYFVGALHTGMRLGELCSLRWGNVTLPIRDIFVPKSKSGKSRHIPIDDTLYKLLKNLYGEGKNPQDFVFGNLYSDFVSHRFIKVCKEVGIKDFVFHSLRHTFASYLVMSGVNIYQVSKWLGHASVTTTEKYYAHLSPDHKREEIQKLNLLDKWSSSEEGSPKSHPTFENFETSQNPEDAKMSVDSTF